MVIRSMILRAVTEGQCLTSASTMEGSAELRLEAP